MKKIDFKNRIQSNPRLLRLKNPITGQIIDYEIQDLQESEIVENGTEMTAEVLNTMQSNIEESCVAVSPTQPITNERVWIQKGKNRLKLEETTQTVNGVTITINSDGSITLNGTATDNTSFIFSKKIIKDVGDFAFGITTDFSAIGHGFEVGGYVYGADGQYKYNISTNQPTKTLSDGEYISNFNIYFSSGAVFNNFVIYPQLEQGSTATEYEAYIEETVWVKNDNGVYIPFKPENKPINIETGVEFETGRIIDGKKEYGKRIDCGALPNTGTITIPHGLDFYNICLTHIEGIAQRDTFVIILPYVSYEASWQIELIVSNTNIMITTKDDKSVYTSSNVTIYYTKN